MKKRLSLFMLICSCCLLVTFGSALQTDSTFTATAATNQFVEAGPPSSGFTQIGFSDMPKISEGWFSQLIPSQVPDIMPFTPYGIEPLEENEQDPTVNLADIHPSSPSFQSPLNSEWQDTFSPAFAPVVMPVNKDIPGYVLFIMFDSETSEEQAKNIIQNYDKSIARENILRNGPIDFYREGYYITVPVNDAVRVKEVLNSVENVCIWEDLDPATPAKIVGNNEYLAFTTFDGKKTIEVLEEKGLTVELPMILGVQFFSWRSTDTYTNHWPDELKTKLLQNQNVVAAFREGIA